MLYKQEVFVFQAFLGLAQKCIPWSTRAKFNANEENLFFLLICIRFCIRKMQCLNWALCTDKLVQYIIHNKSFNKLNLQ